MLSIKKNQPSAYLALADGTVFKGVSIGAAGHRLAELVVNTAMSGHQEMLTNPSYAQHILCLTYPHIGNVGINDEDSESERAQISGLVVRHCAEEAANFRASQSLGEWLKANDIVAISEIDTRRLTRHVMTHGRQVACLFVGEDEAQAVRLAREYAEQQAAAQEANTAATAATAEANPFAAYAVSRSATETWQQGLWTLGQGYATEAGTGPHVVVYDVGVKRSLLRLLAAKGARVTVVPATTDAASMLALQPDGVLLSNGPGDPSACVEITTQVRQLLEQASAQGIAVLGLGLGLQLMAQALGAKTYALKTGHHGVNHPVKDLRSGRVWITQQHHNYAVDEASLAQATALASTTDSAPLVVTHRSLFDQSVQGLRLGDLPIFGFQGFPVSSSDRDDVVGLVDEFFKLMAAK